MRINRLIGSTAAAASVLLCITAAYWMKRALVGDIPHAHGEGARLSIASFRPNEQIKVTSAHGDRGVKHREYWFYWAGGQRYVDISGNRDSMESATTEHFAKGRPVTDSEAGRLDGMVAYFRRRGEEHAIGVAEYRFTYFRDHQQIGEEFFVGYLLPRELAYNRREERTGDPPRASEYERLAADGGITGPELQRLMPFELLEDEPGGE